MDATTSVLQGLTKLHALCAVLGAGAVPVLAAVAARLFPELAAKAADLLLGRLSALTPSQVRLAHAALHFANVEAPNALPDAVKARAVDFLVAHAGMKNDVAQLAVGQAWAGVKADLEHLDAATAAPGGGGAAGA
jgi:hypothetical protein